MKKQSFLKNSLLLIAAIQIGAISVSNAQVTLSYPDATPAATFTTIKAAYDSIYFPNHAGAHTIVIESSYDPSLETYPITLGAKTGASATNAITIKPATGAKKAIGPANQTVIASGLSFSSGATSIDLAGKITNGDISQIGTTSYVAGIGVYASSTFKQVASVAGTTVTLATGTITANSGNGGNRIYFGPAQTSAVKFNGAKYVTIDGVSRTDANTGLTIKNPNSIFAQTIFFAGNSQYNTVKNCVIRGANQSGAWQNGFQGTIFFQAGTGFTCSYNTIDNNDICDMGDTNIPYPIAAIQMTAAGGTHTNQTISNNNIYNISNQYAGNGTCTFMQFGSESAAKEHSVLNNRFYWTDSTTFAAAAINFINCGTLGLGHKFERNTIGYASANETGTSKLTFLGSGGTIYMVSNPKNFTIKGNTAASLNITGTTGAKALVGFQIAVHTGGTTNADNCYGNTVKDIVLNSNGGNATFYGIMLPAAPFFNLDVKNNVVKNITVQSTTSTYTNSVYGVYANFASSGTIAINYTGNEISNIQAGNTGSSAANVITAFMSGGCSNIFEKNLVYNINTVSTGTGSLIKGLRFSTSKADGITLKNNIVRLGTDVTSDAEISAIINEGLSSNGHPFNIYHNTIYIGGASQTKPSHCFNHSASANHGLITLKNNIFSNVRTGGKAVNQVYNMLRLPAINTSANNLYQYGTVFATKPSTSSAPATYATLADWNIARADSTLSADDLSKDQADPKFKDAVAATPDMHLTTGSAAIGAALNLTATVADDYYSTPRTGSITLDMGAVVSQQTTALVPERTSSNSVYSIAEGIVFSNLAGHKAVICTAAGQVVKSISLTSDKATVSVAKGLYIVKVAGKATKVMVK